MLPLLLLSIASAAQAISLPRQENNATGTPVYIACVLDTKIASLTQSVAVNATSREECSSSCSTSSDLAFYQADTSECYCAPASDAPTPDEVVYAVDEVGNCRSQDDASVEYLHSSYTLETCKLPPISTPSSSSIASSPIDCLTSCPDTTQSIAVRPEYDGTSDTFQYECGCYDSPAEQIEGQGMDCGFGINAIYSKN
ncbi:hypothetical protein I302_104192 [Kwoniella bestiolae CBS 10118]|uniref:WSC domain-containing protein n=1 Tax=Kwoniella bestiolae CBS 10118 TaxID=1296100 RepID=A0A1B9GAL2_9TREE|nr:hypothetical protein I302_02901 [Kwoniella bestiolae CBS 10118]OCF28050.1 hypothetical protein I302_02901 [Kwoniella bestiolae CBS 10118]